MNTENEIIHFRLSGFWSKSIVDEIGYEMIKLFKQKIESFNGKSFFAIADLTDFQMPSDRAKFYIKQVMDYGFVNHLALAVEVTPKALVKMEIQDVASKSKADKKRIQAISINDAYEIINRYRMNFCV